MNKTFKDTATVVLMLGLGTFAACGSFTTGSPATPAQTALNAAVVGCNGVKAAMVEADKAILSNGLKGSAADTTVKALGVAYTSCQTALATLNNAAVAANAASAASGATK